ncbi:MAG: DUF2608 domain-containing protein [Holosporaceae bacterium]|jgi:hypothetical protein|nr:DUF2608 domain-containing protein [Holosporaceae bacterium]
MLKKMFIAWGAVFCLQAAQSEIIKISGGWKQMHEEILSRVINFSGNAMVGFDCDNIICYLDKNKKTQLTDEIVITTLEDLERAQVPFLCMTGAISTEWIGRRRNFKKVGVDHFFREETRCFLKEWKQEEGDGKKYYVDTEWNTVYTRRAIGYVYTEQTPFDYQNYTIPSWDIRHREYRNFVKKCPMQSKGYVFNELIKDEFIAEPDLFIFADDQIGLLNGIEESCAQSGIPFVGLHCRSYVPQQ